MRKCSFCKLARDERGASAVELALLAPVLILFTFMILEFTLALSAYLRASEALRAAARAAVVEPAIADLRALDAAPATCSNSGGSVSCPGFAVSNAGAYTRILAAAQAVLPDITAAQLQVTYSSSGSGFSTTAGGTAPLVTVRLVDYEHPLVVANLVPGLSSITFPDFTTSRIKPF